MTSLKEFLTELAQDPKRLGEFIHDPEKMMMGADLSDEDQKALKSGFTRPCGRI